MASCLALKDVHQGIPPIKAQVGTKTVNDRTEQGKMMKYAGKGHMVDDVRQRKCMLST